MAPDDREELSKVAEEGLASIGYNDLVCGMCPAFEPFKWAEKCKAGCTERHESVRGLCRLRGPVVDAMDHEKARWPVVNTDDWCVEGRDMMAEALDEEEAAREADDE